MAAKLVFAMSARVVAPDLVVVPNGVMPHGMMVSDPVMMPRSMVEPVTAAHRVPSSDSVSVMDGGMIAMADMMPSRMGRVLVARVGCRAEMRKWRRRWRDVGRRWRPLIRSGL